VFVKMVTQELPVKVRMSEVRKNHSNGVSCFSKCTELTPERPDEILASSWASRDHNMAITILVKCSTK